MAKLSIQVPNRDLDSTVEYLCRAAGITEPEKQTLAAAEEFLANYVRITIINIAEQDENSAEVDAREARRDARRAELIESVKSDAAVAK